MNRVICAKGHFYDGDKYRECPHCAAGIEAIGPDPFSVRHDQTEAEKREEGPRRKGERYKEKKDGFFHRRKKGQEEQKEAGSGQETDAVRETVLLRPEEREELFGMEESDEDDDRTVGYFSSSVGRAEPPTGYLVCTAGRDYGRGFPLKAGNNSIGRSAAMDVAVTDERVSRDRQASVVYEPIKREFYIKPGEGTGLCYLNGELVLAPAQMKAYDKLLLGETTLMLVPVCCEKFSWDEKM